MKNLFKATLTLAIAVVMMSCGGSADSANFVGNWTPDLSTIDVKVSDVIPSDATGELDGMLDGAKEGQKEVDKNGVLEFKEDGTVTIGDKHETKDFEWKVDGSELHIFGKIEDATPDFNGKDFDLAFEILDSSADKFTIKLTAQSIYDQLKTQFPEQVKDAEKQLGMFKMFMTEKVMTESWASISFKKKEAHA